MNPLPHITHSHEICNGLRLESDSHQIPLKRIHTCCTSSTVLDYQLEALFDSAGLHASLAFPMLTIANDRRLAEAA